MWTKALSRAEVCLELSRGYFRFRPIYFASVYAIIYVSVFDTKFILTMDKKSKILIQIFFAAIFVSAAFVFMRYMIFKQYEVIEGEPAPATAQNYGD